MGTGMGIGMGSEMRQCVVCVCVCVSGGQVVCGRIRRVAYFGWDFPSSE